jgi:hypothetical protein
MPRHITGMIVEPLVGDMCETHENVPAVKRLVGETDSWGSEYIPICGQCHTKWMTDLKEKENRNDPKEWVICESCKTSDQTTKHRFDPSESGGGTYMWCSKCYWKVHGETFGNGDEDQNEPQNNY